MHIISYAMANNQNVKVDQFVRGMCKYISHLFETGNVPEFLEGEYSPSESLRILFDRCVNHRKNNLEYLTFAGYLSQEDRINVLQTNFKKYLKQAAQLMEPLDFLNRCVTYIIAGNYLKQNGFLEAPDITRVAIYEAFVDSEQHHYLRPWFYLR